MTSKRAEFRPSIDNKSDLVNLNAVKASKSREIICKIADGWTLRLFMQASVDGVVRLAPHITHLHGVGLSPTIDYLN